MTYTDDSKKQASCWNRLSGLRLKVAVASLAEHLSPGRESNLTWRATLENTLHRGKFKSYPWSDRKKDGVCRVCKN